VVLGCLTAIGTIYEYRTDVNLFYRWADKLPGVGVSPDPSGIDAQGRRTINGPTGHGLAVAAMMAMVLPFAINLYVHSTQRANKRLYGVAIAILFAGGIATVRKTSVVVPVSALVVMTMYRPRQMIRLLPLGVIVLAVVHVAAPGAMGGVRNQLDPTRLFSQSSSEGRTEDYKAVGPDIHARPVLGRGYGTYDPLKYRFIDNQYLLMLIETGVIGTGIYIILILSVVRVAHRAIRARDPIRGPPALAASAAAVAFGISNLLFDVLAFPHVPYLFGFVAGIGIACGYEERMAATVTAGKHRTRRAPALGWQSSTT
jgi:O-antigen ligase